MSQGELTPGTAETRRHPRDGQATLGTLYIVSAASGTGKTTLVSALVHSEKNIVASISYTTRPKRPEESESVHYHFVDDTEFRRMIASDDFLEHAEVFGNRYGTSRDWVLRQLTAGMDVILEIDWQGARQVRKRFGDALGIFILPPSRAALEQRLHGRGQDSETVIAHRMADAVSEMSHFPEFDYLVFNDDFDTALAELLLIVRSGRLRRRPQVVRHQARIQGLVESPPGIQ